MGQTRFLSLDHAIQVLNVCLQRDFECTLAKKKCKMEKPVEIGFLYLKKVCICGNAHTYVE